MPAFRTSVLQGREHVSEPPRDEQKVVLSLTEAQRLWRLETAVEWLLAAEGSRDYRTAVARVKALLAERPKPPEEEGP